MSVFIYICIYFLIIKLSFAQFTKHFPLFSVFKPQWLCQWNAKEMRHVCSLAALSLSFSVSHSIALSFHCAWRSRFIDGTVWQAKQSYKRQTHEALQVLLVLHSSCCIRRRCCCCYLLAQHFVYI